MNQIGPGESRASKAGANRASRGEPVAPALYSSQMARRDRTKTAVTKPAQAAQPAPPQAPRLPRRALERIHLGTSFAEYDSYLNDPSVFVRTPAIKAAVEYDNPHCFFVGRRGTGKTATTRYLMDTSENVLIIRPEIFSPNSLQLPMDAFSDANQKPFRSLLAAFKRSLLDEILFNWLGGKIGYTPPDQIRKERDNYGHHDFDIRVLHFIASYTKALAENDDIEWLSAIKTTKQITKEMDSLAITDKYTIVLDAIDDFWDGSQQAVLYLTALMHAALEVNTQTNCARVLIFLRENIFERVRLFDNEFSRLETCVVGLDWTEQHLIEMIERRVNAPLNTKLQLGGTTWDAFFEDGPQARKMVLEFCQHRPRDVLTYCTLALDSAQDNRRTQVAIEDLQGARRRFSDSRLKDLSDEYQENYPQIAVILDSFYGLGQRFSIPGMEDFLHRLLDDHQVVSSCKEWIYEHSTVERFVRLLYEIGFVGLADMKSGSRKATPIFRSLGPRDTTPPAISQATEILVHPSYHEALDLQDAIVSSLGEDQHLRRSGIILEIPGTLKLDEYRDFLSTLMENLKTMPNGRDTAYNFEELVGDVLRLCFFRPLNNVQEQAREIEGTIRRDWVASNRGQYGFWEMVRSRYKATQVIFECKNYSDLSASDFQQASYYMSDAAGRFIVIVFRGEVKKHYFAHIKRALNNNNGMILLLNDKDLNVFMRQARNGVVKDDHIMDRYDLTVRSIS